MPIETLRPNAAGDITELTPHGAVNNWQCVDEAVPDEDTTYVDIEDDDKKDLYNLPAHSGSGTINKITVYQRSKEAAPEAVSYSVIKIGGIIHYGDLKAMTTSYQTFNHEWAINPTTSVAWTWADIDNLQIGVRLDVISGTHNFGYCTQVYVEVDYSLAAAGGAGSAMGAKMIAGKLI